MRCLVKNHGALLVLQCGQPLLFLTAVGRQKTFEHKPTRRLPGNAQRRDSGAGRGHGHHGNAPGVCVPHDDLPGVGNGGHTRVAAQRAGFPGLDAVQNITAPLFQIVLIIAHHRLFQAQVVQQLQRHTGVFGGNKIRFCKGFRRAWGKVAQIADGRCHDIQSAAHGASFFGSVP